MNPKNPVYILSKGRWESRLTSRAFERMKMPYRIIIEASEYREYASVIEPRKILVLDPKFQRDYDACCELKSGQSKGSGPSRNFAWEHAISEGFDWHWIVDDNIRDFLRLNRNQKIEVEDGTIFKCMEDFCERYRNIALAGPNYRFFANQNARLNPFILNSKVYSCILIRNDIPLRWRARYNEDVDLSLRALKRGFCTVQFNAFLQNKMRTQNMKGGNTDELYKHGTEEKSKMIARLHPDVARVVWKFGRIHHHVDYRKFKSNVLIKRSGIGVAGGVDNYGMSVKHVR